MRNHSRIWVICLFLLFFISAEGIPSTDFTVVEEEVKEALIKGEWNDVINASSRIDDFDGKDRLADFLRYVSCVNKFDVGLAKYYFDKYYIEDGDSPEMKEIKEWVKAFVEKYPDNVYVRIMSATVKGNLDLMISELNTARKLDPENVFVRFKLGLAYKSKKRFDLAIKELAAASKLQPGNYHVLVNLSIAYERGKLFKEAASVLEEAVKVSPFPSVYVKLGDLYAEMHDTDKAVSSFLIALSKNPDNESKLYIHNNLAYLYLNKKNYPKAVENFEMVKTLNQTNPTPWIMLGRLYVAKNEYQKAEAEFKAALGIQFANPVIHLYLGDLYMYMNKLEMAEAEYNKSKELDDANDIAYFKLALIHLSHRNIQKAKDEFEISLKYNNRNALAHYYLGVIYYFEDQKALALLEMKTAVALRPDFESARKNLEAMRLAENK